MRKFSFILVALIVVLLFGLISTGCKQEPEIQGMEVNLYQTSSSYYGYYWTSYNRVSLDKLFSGTLRNSTTYNITISGSVNVNLDHLQLSLVGRGSDSYYHLGDFDPLEISIPVGQFNKTFVFTTYNSDYVSSFPNDRVFLYFENYGVPFNPAVLSGDAVATIRNFTMSINER